MKKIFREILNNKIYYLLIAPDMFLFIIFIIRPGIWTLHKSFYKQVTGGGYEWIGLNNYVYALSDKIFLNSLLTALIIGVSVTIMSMALGLIAAQLVDSLKGSIKYIARSTIFTPTLCALVVTSVIWKTLLLPDGIIQSFFKLFGIITPNWLSDPTFALLSIIIVSTWQSIGFNMVFFLAGLQGIPNQFYEAAMVDGASFFSRFRWITIPLLQPITLFLIVMNSLNNFKMFDQIMTLTRGGPMNTTMITTVYIYRLAFSQNRYAYASALAVIFAVVLFGVSLMQFKSLKNQVEY